MGAWGYETFDNDEACDILSEFEELMEEGLSEHKALTSVCEEWYGFSLNSEERLFALVDLQMEYSAYLHPELFVLAKEACRNNIFLEDWDKPEVRKVYLDNLLRRIEEFEENQKIGN